MKRRTPQAAGGLPADLAGGPVVPLWGANEREARSAWLTAGSEWSRANGYSWNGWLSLLPEYVRKELYTRRLRRAVIEEGQTG